jgi:uncharacterized protein (TIGR00255 family)
MESMTGYASIEKSTEQFSYSIEVKSLNSKYLEIQTNLPRILRNNENDFITILKKNFKRGKLELSIELFDWVESRTVSINTELMNKYYHELQKVQKKLGIGNTISFDLLVTLDGVLHKRRTNISEKSRRDIYGSLEIIIKKMLEMRRKEGNSIKIDVQKSLSEISSCARRIKTLSKGISKNLYQKLKTNINSLTQVNVDNVRLYTEIAILADKMDINEEIIRLNDHLKKFKTTLQDKGQIGKKLDFLAQEMFREINTVASKSASSEISHLVVEVKNNIDKIREHCRNIV